MRQKAFRVGDNHEPSLLTRDCLSDAFLRKIFRRAQFLALLTAPLNCCRHRCCTPNICALQIHRGVEARLASIAQAVAACTMSEVRIKVLWAITSPTTKHKWLFTWSVFTRSRPLHVFKIVLHVLDSNTVLWRLFNPRWMDEWMDSDSRRRSYWHAVKGLQVQLNMGK